MKQVACRFEQRPSFVHEVCRVFGELVLWYDRLPWFSTRPHMLIDSQVMQFAVVAEPFGILSACEMNRIVGVFNVVDLKQMA
jgi:hypothetical protein